MRVGATLAVARAAQCTYSPKSYANSHRILPGDRKGRPYAEYKFGECCPSPTGVRRKKSLSQMGQAQKLYYRENQAFSRARVLVVRSQTSVGPKY